MNTSMRFSRFVESLRALYPDDTKEQRVGECIIWYTIGDDSKRRPVAMSTIQDYIQFLERVSDDGKCCVCFFKPVSSILTFLVLAV